MHLKILLAAVLYLLSGSVLLIGQTTQPVPVQISQKIENRDGVYFHLHPVEKGQTLYSIARKYQVKQTEIKRTSDKVEIQTDEILLIPVNAKRIKELSGSDSIQKIKNAAVVQKDTTPKKSDSLPQLIFSYPPKTTLNIALMLPLYLNDIEKIQITPKDKKTKKTPDAFTFITLYEGAKLAMELFDSNSISIKLHVFDVTNEVSTAEQLIHNKALDSIDLIIGPVYLHPFKLMSDYAKQRGIFIINPLSEKNEILGNNPFVIKIQPSDKTILQTLLQQIDLKDTLQRILILSDHHNPQEAEYLQQVQPFFEALSSPMKPVFIDISKDKTEQIQPQLSATKKNIILYLSTNEAIITEILTQFSKLDKMSIALYCLHNLKQFEFIEPQYLHNLRMHYAEPFFVDPSLPAEADFEYRFFNTYQTIPDKNAYLGFDITTYALQLLKIGNTNYGNFLESYKYKGFHNTIQLRRSGASNGFENQSVNILKTENSQLKKANE